MVTIGEKGSFFYTPSGSGILPAYPVTAVDTTGAGDAFLGAFHHCIQRKSLHELVTMKREEWISMMKFANASGGLTASKKGAIPAMPPRSEIMALVNCGV